MSGDPFETVRVSDIVSTADVARLCGVSQPCVSNWKARHGDFPRPFAVIANGRTDLFRKSDIVAWYRDRIYGTTEPPEILQIIRQEEADSA